MRNSSTKSLDIWSKASPAMKRNADLTNGSINWIYLISMVLDPHPIYFSKRLNERVSASRVRISSKICRYRIQTSESIRKFASVLN